MKTIIVHVQFLIGCVLILPVVLLGRVIGDSIIEWVLDKCYVGYLLLPLADATFMEKGLQEAFGCQPNPGQWRVSTSYKLNKYVLKVEYLSFQTLEPVYSRQTSMKWNDCNFHFEEWARSLARELPIQDQDGYMEKTRNIRY